MSKEIDSSCIKCGTRLNEDNWAPYRQRNYINKCNDCIRTEKREYIANWRKNNPRSNAERSKRCKAKLRATDPVRARAQEAYGDCRKRALSVGMEFSLTPGDVLALMRETLVCPYFGWLLTHCPGKLNTLASVDRIDSSRGYTKDNVRVISYLANLMKSRATEAELLAFAEGVIRQFGLGAMRMREKEKGVAAK